MQFLSAPYAVTPELALVTGTRSLTVLAHHRHAGWKNPVPSPHDTLHPPQARHAVELIVCFIPQLLLRFVPDQPSEDQVEPPCEYGFSGSVPDSSSVGNQGSPDRNAGPICVDRVFVPACEVWVALATLTVGSVETARSPHLPADPASDTVGTLVLWRTGAAVLGVGVTGPSLPVCPFVTTIMHLLSNSGFTGYSFFLIKRHKVCATGLTQVVLVPCLITYFSVVSQSRFCAQGLRALAQVALAYLNVSKKFYFPGITSGTISPGLISKYPGQAPKGARFLWCHSLGLGRGGGGCWLVCLSHRGSGLGGFRLAHPRALCGVLYSDTLSARDVGWSPRPTGSLTARVLVNGGSALPRISTCLSSRPSSSVVTWDCASTLSHRLI